MKKTIALLLVLLLGLALLAGCADKKTTSNEEPSAPSQSAGASISSSPSTSKEDLPFDGTVTAAKENGTVKVTVSLPQKGQTLCSLLLVTDLSYQYTFAQGDGRLCDMKQIALDEKGEASATLQLNGVTETVYLIVTADDGTFATVTVK
jgi:hypothetical protein